jgi:hypothetical protein
MAGLKTAFLIVAVILFLIDALLYWIPNQTFGSRLTPLGLAFFAGSFLVSS